MPFCWEKLALLWLGLWRENSYWIDRVLPYFSSDNSCNSNSSEFYSSLLSKNSWANKGYFIHWLFTINRRDFGFMPILFPIRPAYSCVAFLYLSFIPGRGNPFTYIVWSQFLSCGHSVFFIPHFHALRWQKGCQKESNLEESSRA